MGFFDNVLNNVRDAIVEGNNEMRATLEAKDKYAREFAHLSIEELEMMFRELHTQNSPDYAKKAGIAEVWKRKKQERERMAGKK